MTSCAPVSFWRWSRLIAIGLCVAAPGWGGARPALGAPAAPDALQRGFANPPASAKPHTWWHWINGNVTREGITADLEAMKRVGVGGAQIFNVDCGITPGPVKFMSPEWDALIAHAVKEANRLGIELCVHDCGGWSSSGGPWIKPENAMQMVVTREQQVTGPAQLSEVLPQPETRHGYYRDIAVLAFPTPGPSVAAIANVRAKAGYDRNDGLLPARDPAGAEGKAIARDRIVDLTKSLQADGRLAWSVPAGSWTILRVGYTPTGAQNAPATPDARGLEVDKLSAQAMDVFWTGMMTSVLRDAGPLAGVTLNNALIDSYETGCQNWTPAFRQEFQARRGYDPIPFLPVLTGRAVQSTEVSERFLWDFRRTIADLWAQNYYGHFAELCRKAGIKASTEPYGNGVFSDMECGGKVDIPMGEFWVGGGTVETCKLASSIGHTYGRQVVGAESFTATPDRAAWTNDPYSIKALGDLIFTVGINRYIFHRYAHQPWLDRKPGMTMGPWGINFERTNTWWEPGAEWLRYVARCQYLLQQGRFAGDVLFYTGETAPMSLPYRADLKSKGYDYDGCDTPTLMTRLTVRNGRLVLPDGMTYRVLVLPDGDWMTPGLLARVRQLVREGATVLGPRPSASPSLADYPACDTQVREMAAELWGPGTLSAAGERRVGKGRVAWGKPVEQVLAAMKVAPDLDYESPGRAHRLAFIHRVAGNADVYFVSNQRPQTDTVDCTFRIAGKAPELWHPDTGRLEPAPLWRKAADGRVVVPLRFDPSGSVFVVFRRPTGSGDHAVAIDVAEAAPTAAAPAPRLEIRKARYEAVDGSGGAEVTEQLANLARDGFLSLQADNATFGDPTPQHVKRLHVEYVLNGKPGTIDVGENEHLDLGAGAGSPTFPAYTLALDGSNRLTLTAWKEGTFRVRTSRGVRAALEPRGIRQPVDLTGDWQVTFPPNLGAPPSITLPALVSWTDCADPGVQAFSGTATYALEFDGPSAGGGPVVLDLGRVKNLAQVRLNGTDLGVLWKAPFRVDVTRALKPGRNRLEVAVTNLWPNRLIADQKLPPEQRITFATWSPYTAESQPLESGLLGPVTLHVGKTVPVR